MKLHSIILFLTIIMAQNIKSQNIALDGDYQTYDVWNNIIAYYPAKLTLSPIHGGGWEIGFKINSASKDFSTIIKEEEIQDGEIQFPIGGTKIDFSEKGLTLSNDKNQELVLNLEEDSTIYCYIQLKEGWDYYIDYIELPYKESNITDGFHKLVKQILKPYTHKSAKCDNSIIGLINNPLGIDWGDSWHTPFNEFLSVAEHFYGSYDSWRDYFNGQEYNPYTRSYRQNFSIDICGQKVNSIYFCDAYLHYDLMEDLYDDTKYIKSTEYVFHLNTPKAFKKDPQFNKKEECIWNKELALDYCNKIKQELDLLGCNMQKVKSKSICKYEGTKNGKIITLNLSKITDKYTDFFIVRFKIANKTKDYDFYIIWD